MSESVDLAAHIEEQRAMIQLLEQRYNGELQKGMSHELAAIKANGQVTLLQGEVERLRARVAELEIETTPANPSEEEPQ